MNDEEIKKAGMRFREWKERADEDEVMAEVGLREDAPPNPIPSLMSLRKF